MRGKLYKRVSSLLLLVMLCSAFAVFPTFAAGKSATFSLTDADGVKKGQTITVSVEASDVTQGTQVSGMTFRLEYPSSALAYVEGSSQMAYQNVPAPIVGNTTAGLLIVTWDTTSSISLQNGKVLDLNFTVKEGFTSPEEIKLTVQACYNLTVTSGWKIENISTNVEKNGIVTSDVLVDDIVQKLIEDIDNIGTVDASDACKQKLDALYNTYLGLKQAQKNQVTNYNELIQAIKKYEQLVAQESTDPVLSQAAQYRSDYAEALALRMSTIKHTDVEALEKALKAMEELPTNVQLELLREKYMLRNLLEKAKELQNAEDERLAYEELLAQADQLVNEFKNGIYKWVLELTPETVKISDETGVNTAYEELLNMEIINDIAFARLAPELKLLESLRAKIKELKDAEDPEGAEVREIAEAFREKFAYLLGMNPEDLSYEDKLDVYLAYELANSYDASVQEELAKEIEHLSLLKDAVDMLSPEEVTSTIQTRIGLKDASFSIKGRAMSIVVWFLCALCILAGIYVCIMRYWYAKLRKRLGNPDLRREEIE